VSDVIPALALAVEPSDRDIMKCPPVGSNVGLTGTSFVRQVIGHGLFLGVLSLAAYGWALASYGPGSRSRSVAFVTVILLEIAQLLVSRVSSANLFKGPTKSPAILGSALTLVLLQVGALCLPMLYKPMGLSPLPIFDWMVAGGFAATAVLGHVLVRWGVRAAKGRGGA
jgi:Ca2+-transporting ATPase